MTPIFNTQVQCACSKDAIENPVFTFIRADSTSLPTPKTTYVFRLVHTCCCPDSCKDGLPSGGGGDDGGDGKMSYGTLIAILFGALVASYLILGNLLVSYT